MSRIICIDFGLKRCGIATTDPMQIIATGLKVVPPKELLPFLKEYTKTEDVTRILIGLPLDLDGNATHATVPAQKMYLRLKKAFPKIDIEQIDERYSSKMASRALVQMGMRKSKRREKGNLDITAATMMLQEYLEQS